MLPRPARTSQRDLRAVVTDGRLRAALIVPSARSTKPSDPLCSQHSFFQPHGLPWHTLAGVMALCLYFYWREDQGGVGALPPRYQ